MDDMEKTGQKPKTNPDGDVSRPLSVYAVLYADPDALGCPRGSVIR